MANDNGTSQESRISEKDMQTQEARIHRVPPWEWREVKKERVIQPKIPTLIASSKGHGKVGRRSNGRRSSRRNGAPASGDSNQGEEPLVNIAYRLTINSRILLNILGDCTGMDFPEDQNVWLRPFKYLVAYETEIRQALQDAEMILDQVKTKSEPSDQTEAIQSCNGVTNPGTKPTQEDEISADATKIAPNISAVDASRAKAERDQLRCLVEFMDTDMQDIFDVKKQVANKTINEVAFEHLWLLYKPGDLVYTRRSPDEIGTYQAHRVLHVTGGRTILDSVNASGFNEIHDRSWEEESDSEEKARDAIRASPSNVTPFIIDCFSVDFDGNRLGPKSKRYVISTYTAKRKVDTLEVFPSLCHPQHATVYRAMVDRGRRFTRLANGTHNRYAGTTLRESRELWDMNMYYFNYIIHDEEVLDLSNAPLRSGTKILLLMGYQVHSEVMLDQAAAVTHYRKTLEKWRLKIGGRTIGVPTAADRREVFDPLPVKRDEDQFSDVFDDSIIDLDRRNDFVNSTTLLRHQHILDPSLSDDYVMLLPFRIYGYAMLNRKWFPLNINLVSGITPDQVRMTAAGYEDLVLPDGHKKLLQAVVKNQVGDPERTSSGQEEDPDEFQMDVVKGKGKGLIILLHGAPGVGKTSTAECVAAQLKRPLLPITCGDISTQVKQAEETLQEYCALAHRWRCVLLLDEADVFLAKREKGDITRNGLVSGQLQSWIKIRSDTFAKLPTVFLRVLEYFSGVIILTTNRVGEFDEAFRSRIHVSLYYPKLDQDATLKIWDRSLLRLRNSGLRLDFSEGEIRKFAEKHWLDNEHKPSRHWNGRQIKNAFQTALALANWEFFEMKQGRSLERPLLKAKHFDRVAKTSAHFDDYISDIYNISEDTWSILAARDEIRKDDHPAMSLARSQTQDFGTRSKRTPARRGAGTQSARADDGRNPEGGSGKSLRELELELELELLKLKQGTGKEEAQAQDEDDDDEGW